MKSKIVTFPRATDSPDEEFSQQRGGAVLHKLTRRYPRHAAALARAHQVLTGEPQYAQAMIRVAESLESGQIRAFISYRVGVNAQAARVVAEVIRALSANKVQVTFADEFTATISGQDYKSKIEEATRSAHWFIILLSEVHEASGWCMYETGLFRAGITSRSTERLICLHHPKASLPSAIDGFQSVGGEVNRLTRFLDGLFRRPGPLPGWESLNPTLTDEHIADAALRISQVLRPPKVTVEYNHMVKLDVAEPAILEVPNDLAKCLVHTTRETARLFGRQDPPSTWGQLTSSLSPSRQNLAWLHELVAVLRKAGTGDLFRPIAGQFEGRNGEMFRVIVNSMEHDGANTRARFSLLLLEEHTTASERGGISGAVRALLTALRLHNRVRWEVIEQFRDSKWPTDDIEACGKTFGRIEREMQARGGIAVNDLLSIFDSDDAIVVADLLDDWSEERHSERGRLTLSLRNGDADGVRRGIARIERVNRDFLQRALPTLERISAG